MTAPDLSSYDVILVNSSGGKDSQAMLDHVADLAGAAGVRNRVVVLHCDLGHVEWPGALQVSEYDGALMVLGTDDPRVAADWLVDQPDGDIVDCHTGSPVYDGARDLAPEDAVVEWYRAVPGCPDSCGEGRLPLLRGPAAQPRRVPGRGVGPVEPARHRPALRAG